MEYTRQPAAIREDRELQRSVMSDADEKSAAGRAKSSSEERPCLMIKGLATVMQSAPFLFSETAL
jgi:hypothetical protein